MFWCCGGETVAIIGPNGVGKSTLIKTLTGDVTALQGEARPGANVKVGYFAQAHETLNAENSILDEITATKAMPVSAARDFLGRFLFSNDDVFRPVSLAVRRGAGTRRSGQADFARR